MLFNLTQQRCFPHTQQVKLAIGGSSERGPGFYGAKVYELSACNEPFNGYNKCESNANEPGYKIPEENGRNMLTNKGSF